MMLAWDISWGSQCKNGDHHINSCVTWWKIYFNHTLNQKGFVNILLQWNYERIEICEHTCKFVCLKIGNTHFQEKKIIPSWKKNPSLSLCQHLKLLDSKNFKSIIN